MDERVHTIEELKTGIELSTGSRHRIIVVRPPATARVLGKAFQTNKSFLLPGATTGMRRIRALLKKRSPAHLLVVGHCDTTGKHSVNDPLSLERAENALAYIVDDPEPWLKMYKSAIPSKRRWGADEDGMMLQALPDYGSKPADEDAVRWFQRTRGLKVDGDAGPETRGKLIEEYMALDGPSFESLGVQVDLTAHGCGEHFPLDEGGRKVEVEAEDEREDSLDRRVEFFFFSRKLGIQPPPPGPNSKADSPEYPEWRKISRLDFETVIAEGEDDLFLRFHIDPTQLNEYQDSLRLFSTDGSYEMVKLLSTEAELENEYVDVVFTRVRTALSYSLEITTPGTDPYLLFESTPFAELDGLTDPDSDFEDPDPLEPEPD